MATHILDQLKSRGFIAQMSHEDETYAFLDTPGRVFYVGFDPTANSLHAGHLIPLIMMAHLQRAGHIPIAVLGGGTAMVGDPTDRTDMRSMMTQAVIRDNVSRFRDQMSILLDFSDGHGFVEDNASWLLPLNYIDFLREIGSVFSVNKMIAADAYKKRLEHGLSFLEFNYQLMQAYDFLTLFRRYGCRLQFGGNDQWSNILAGVDLIRRKAKTEAYGVTMALLTNASGAKMGKTAAGALWLDPAKTSPFAFYQYWRNVDDDHVAPLLLRMTFLPLDVISDLTRVSGQALNEAKRVLARELTALVHGDDEARQADETAQALFSGRGQADDAMRRYAVSRASLGTCLIDVLTDAGLVPSKSEGRRLMQQGGISLNGTRIDDIKRTLDASDFKDDEAIVRKGKKEHLKLTLT